MSSLSNHEHVQRLPYWRRVTLVKLTIANLWHSRKWTKTSYRDTDAKLAISAQFDSTMKSTSEIWLVLKEAKMEGNPMRSLESYWNQTVRPFLWAEMRRAEGGRERERVSEHGKEGEDVGETKRGECLSTRHATPTLQGRQKRGEKVDCRAKLR